MQAIGQLEQDDARVFGHGKKHFAYGLGLQAAQVLTHTPLLLLAATLSLHVGASQDRSCLFLALQNIQAQHTAKDAGYRGTQDVLDPFERQAFRVDSLEEESGSDPNGVDMHIS